MDKLKKKEMKMTLDSHVNSLVGRECHRGKKTYVKEFDIEMTRLKERLSVFKELLQENVEDQSYGRKLKKRGRWSIMQLFSRKLRYIFYV